MKMRRLQYFFAGLLLAFSGCNYQKGETSSVLEPHSQLPDVSATDPGNPTPSYSTAVLLFNGSGVSTSDWQTTEEIVKSQSLSYRLVNSAQLNAMTLDELASFGVMIVPGGSGGTITSGLTPETRLRVRKAVRERGLGYVGFCAGAWVAVGPEAATDRVASYGIAIAAGAILDLYLPGGVVPTAAIVDVFFPNQVHRNLVWWGGPITPEWQNGVIARYETGDPAISQTWAGKGLVLVSGPHPEAPEGWRATAGNDPDGLDYDIAIDLIQAALTKTPLPAF